MSSWVTEVFKESLNSVFGGCKHEAELAQLAGEAQHLDTAQQLKKEQLRPIVAAPKLGTIRHHEIINWRQLILQASR